MTYKTIMKKIYENITSSNFTRNKKYFKYLKNKNHTIDISDLGYIERFNKYGQNSRYYNTMIVELLINDINISFELLFFTTNYNGPNYHPLIRYLDKYNYSEFPQKINLFRIFKHIYDIYESDSIIDNFFEYVYENIGIDDLFKIEELGYDFHAYSICMIFGKTKDLFEYDTYKFVKYCKRNDLDYKELSKKNVKRKLEYKLNTDIMWY